MIICQRFILIPSQDPTGHKILVYYDADSFYDKVNRFTYDGVVMGHCVACFYSISHRPRYSLDNPPPFL